MASLTNPHANDSVQVVSYNMHGFNQGITMLKSLCSKYRSKFIFLQEHWLTPDQLSNFNCFNDNYMFYSYSSMSNILNNGILRGRPFQGLAVLVDKNLCSLFNTITVVACEDRYIILTLDNLLLINVYLPSCKTALERDELESTFNRLELDLAGLNYCYAIIG